MAEIGENRNLVFSARGGAYEGEGGLMSFKPISAMTASAAFIALVVVLHLVAKFTSGGVGGAATTD